MKAKAHADPECLQGKAECSQQKLGNSQLSSCDALTYKIEIVDWSVAFEL